MESTQQDIKENTTDVKAVVPQNADAPDELHARLIKTIREYRPSTDLSAIEKAYELAKEAHKHQKRKSGEPYIIHPLWVAIILAELEMDRETIIAGLLHDVIEDTDYSEEEMTAEFGSEVTFLVDGVTKLTNLNYSSDKLELQAESLRKMFLAMAKDIRVILIKLADRLHNMRTLQYRSAPKQKEIANETRDIYAPIAQRLGISRIKVELDDLSLKYLEPDVYQEIKSKIATKKDEREAFVEAVIAEVRDAIGKAGIEAEIYGRVKHFFSIYKKMLNQGKTLDQMYDLFAVRLLVDNVKDCYAALGVIHELYKPIPGRFKDYIAMPKPNQYQSLHTTLIRQGQPFEIQIRTYDMHRTAEYGIAAHWKYKEQQDGRYSQDSEEEKLTWLRQVLELQRDLPDNKEFMSLLKNDFDMFSESVFCFTPTGDVKNLPAGSNTIDFAYSIHSAVGNKMVGARVNNKLVPIDYVIQNGDSIEIITSQNSRGPSRDWLAIVKSTQAKNKINQWFKEELKDDNIAKGKEMLATYCKVKGINLSNILKPEFMEACMNKYGFRDFDSIYAAIGRGGLKEGQIANKLLEEYDKKNKKQMTDEDVLEGVTNGRRIGKGLKRGIIVQGIDDVSVHFSKCCSPVPGDEIVGFVTRGRGVSIHRTDCINVLSLKEDERARLIEAEWNVPEDKQGKEVYYTELKLFASNRNGILVDLTKIFTEAKIEMQTLTARTSKQGTATITVGFEIANVEQIHEVMAKLRGVAGVMDIIRTMG